jgi:hypothetical protein
MDVPRFCFKTWVKNILFVAVLLTEKDRHINFSLRICPHRL